MRKALPAVLVLLSLLATAGVPVPAAAAPDDGLAPEGVTVHVDIAEDGDARWTVSTRYLLNDSSERRAFDRVATSFERGQGSLGFSLQTFEQVVPRVAERTGRDMAVRDPRWSSTIQNESGEQWGALRLSFTWTNFAHVDNESVMLSGAFAGGWFGDLGPNQTLVVSPPAGYEVSSAQPSHETVNGTLRWTGPVEFGPNEPVATFYRQPTVPWMSIAGAVLTALVIGGIVAYAWFWRSSTGAGTSAEAGAETPGEAIPGGERAPEAGGDEAGGGAGTSAETGAGGGPGGPAEGGGSGAGAAVGGAESGGAESGGGEAGAGEGGEPELLSDEERVERLLEQHGGRMKQAKIVDETRWSNAKVSQLLSQMADEGRVEKLRIGRENLISLPEDGGDGHP